MNLSRAYIREVTFEKVEEVVLVDEVSKRDERIILTTIDKEHTSDVAHVLKE